MKQTLNLFLALMVALSSCKKEVSKDLLNSDNLSQKDPSPEEPDLQGKPVTCAKVDLFLDQYGVYRANYEGFTVTASNLSYLLYSNGQPLPLRDGDPAFGTITVTASAGEDVIIQPNVPKNNFALSRIVWGVNNFIDTSYSNAVYQATTTWLQQMTIFNSLPPGQQPPLPPTMAFIKIKPHIKIGSNGGSGVQIFTGKLIRSTTGNSTFAIACEDFPIPPPIQPVLHTDEITLHKTATIGNSTVDVYLKYNTITGTVFDANVYLPGCTPSAVTSFSTGTFSYLNNMNWTTPHIITITCAAGTFSITGIASEQNSPC